MSRARFQQGLLGALLAIVLVIAMIAIIAGHNYYRGDAQLGQQGTTSTSLQRLSDALVVFASQNKRLPCPAAGNSTTGTEDWSGTTATCTSPGGVAPWATLSLRKEDILDGWGRRISYRVFSGATGLTQANGVSMTNCNTSLGAPINVALAAGSLCASGSPPPNTHTQFLTARGNMIVVQDQGTARNGNAFVLISHGGTGRGAFLAEGATARVTLPNAGGNEFVNTGSSGTYWNPARNIPPATALNNFDPPSDASHFDDVVTYMSFSDLVDKVKLGARTWKDVPLATTLSSTTVVAAAAAAGRTYNPGTSEDTNLSSLGIGGFLVGASASGTTQDIGFVIQDGIGGIGVIGGGSTSGDLNSFFGEMLTFQLGTASEYGKMDVALNQFQVTDNVPLEKERAQVAFYDNGSVAQTSIVDSWDFSGNPTNCLFRLVSGGVFDRMDVAPLTQTAGGGSTRFTVAAIKACTDATTPCATSISGAVACSIRPPSVASNVPSTTGMTTATLSGTVEDNGVAKGSGTGYRVTTGAGAYALGRNRLPLTTGSGTILAGNCLTISSDPNTYVVATGNTGPGDIFLADPGLLQSIPGSTTRNITLIHCPTAVSFDYGTSCSYGTNVTATPATINAGAGITSVSASISGLTCGTTYYARTKAVSLGAATTGSDRLFTTVACSVSAPGAQTNDPINIGTTTATLYGFANDKGAATTVTFDYGLDSCYGSSAAATPGTVAAGTGSTSVIANLTGLACNTYYHYRVKAVSSGGTSTGSDTVFLTSACP